MKKKTILLLDERKRLGRWFYKSFAQIKEPQGKDENLIPQENSQKGKCNVSEKGKRRKGQRKWKRLENSIFGLERK